MNFSEIFNVIIRALISLVSLFFVTKLIGKRQVSQMTLFDYVIGISIGNFAAEMTVNLETEEINGIVAVIIFGLIAYLISLVTLKSMLMRRFLKGVPTVIIQNGEILEKNMRKTRIDINDLLEQLRKNGYFDIGQVSYAILELNGELSILPKSKYKPVNLKDMNLVPQLEGLCANVVIDGKIMNKNLKMIKKDKEWLMQQLQIKGYKNIKNILLVTIDINDKISIYERNLKIKSLDVLK